MGKKRVGLACGSYGYVEAKVCYAAGYEDED
jgi:hypothetical protein